MPDWVTLWGIADVDLGHQAMKIVWDSKLRNAAAELGRTLEKVLDSRCSDCGYSLSGFRANINPNLCAPCENNRDRRTKVEEILDKTWEKNRLGF